MRELEVPFDAALVLQKKRALKKALLQKPGLLEKKVAIVGGSTVGEIKNILELFLLEAGIKPSFYEGGYGLFYENVVFDDGSLAAFAPDILYIHTSSRNLQHWPEPADSPGQAAEKLESELARFEAVWKAAAALGCPVVQNNFELPAWRNFGNMDAWDARGRVQYVRRLNQHMADYAAAQPQLYIHDLEYLSSSFGLDAWCDSAAWYAYKYCCAVACIPHFCHSLAQLMKSLFGMGKKAIASDLDNTLWGGIIGEVGPEGVELGDESPAGMAFADFQRYLRCLAGRGVLLNVASKNEEAAALSGFARADSPLKREDFLCFEANWGPKTESIARMAAALNILPESFVFVDDNPAERELVRRELPGVAVPELGEVEGYIRAIDRAGYFEVTALSADDQRRGEMYRQNARRAGEMQSFGNYEDYLKSLAMTAEIAPVSPERLERVTQLVNKTNQFNLTTRRYTTAEMEGCMKNPACITLAGRLMDRFGDNGITSVILAERQGDSAEIELWVMSCRVFKRHFEYAMFDALVAKARALGLKTLRGCWRKTPKNGLVRDFYETLGFAVEEDGEDIRRFCYEIPEDYAPKNGVIQVGAGEGDS